MQHGFLKGFSTITQFLQVIDEIYSIIEKRGQIDSVFLDFRKAFYSVSYELFNVRLLE